MKMIITIETEDQYQEILVLLQEAEEEGTLDFDFNIQKDE